MERGYNQMVGEKKGVERERIIIPEHKKSLP